MAHPTLISRYTPSRTDPQVLEQIFVQRHTLLDDAVERVRESAFTANKHHLLFFGPRGCGKTHLITLLHHRVQQMTDLKKILRIAWLPENVTITSFYKLLIQTYQALAKAYTKEFFYEDLDPLFECKVADPEPFLRDLLIKKLAGRTLLVLLENLDGLFRNFKGSQQHKWRAFIQDHPIVSIVATAQRLTDDTTKRDKPFFGFFQQEYLKTLSYAEAAELLARIARIKKKTDLAQFLEEPTGRARIRALHHLSGGNHRIYIVLSECITRNSLDGLVEAFEKMIDELTPYYQERMNGLPPQQQEIIQFLCVHPVPAAVKAIARHIFATHQTVAAQLKKLREMGYVVSHPQGRESFYELAEPLMRLCVEVKEHQRTQPMGLIVDFLRIWYDPDPSEERLSPLSKNAIETSYIRDGLEKLVRASIDPRVQWLKDKPAQFAGDSDDKIQILEEWANEKEDKESSAKFAVALFNRGINYAQQGKTDKAVADLTKVTAITGVPEKIIAYAYGSVTVLYFTNKDWDSGLKALSQGLQRALPYKTVSKVLFNCILDYGAAGWEDIVADMVAVHSGSNDNYMGELGGGLVRSLASVEALQLSEAKSIEWKIIWKRHAEIRKELQVPYRIFAAGMDYLMAKDQGCLLRLPKEEREILKQALNLNQEWVLNGR